MKTFSTGFFRRVDSVPDQSQTYIKNTDFE